MAVRIQKSENCVGCGICVLVCPMDVLRLEKGCVRIAYPQECMCCAGCEMECPGNVLFVTPEKYDPILVSWK